MLRGLAVLGILVLLAFSVVTYLTVVFGELVPKALTLARAETLAAAVAIPIEVMTKVLRPIVTSGEGGVWYKSATMEELLRDYRAKGLGTSALDHFRI